MDGNAGEVANPVCPQTCCGRGYMALWQSSSYCLGRPFSCLCSSLDELTLLTNAIERCNIDDVSEQLPSYMKLYYLALLDVYIEIEKELAKENNSFQVKYSIAEAKWYYGNNVPTMEQYVKNENDRLGIGNEATKEAHDWLASEPLILVASSIIVRLSNDIVSHELIKALRDRSRNFNFVGADLGFNRLFELWGHISIFSAILMREQEGGDISGVECYMNEYGVTKEKAYVEIRKIVDNSWKDLNRECLKRTVVPRVLLMPVLNLARMSEFSYKDEDSYTVSKNDLRDIISEVLVDPITI
ncbi:sesquiterpene synthase 15-like [Nicotiana tabacum]|uniref:Sesquiterpene synthase 15-like n=1 Tax=Nicotiana tabacum TaxID=4097 RepID=A0AC58SGV4_TOBAC